MSSKSIFISALCVLLTVLILIAVFIFTFADVHISNDLNGSYITMQYKNFTMLPFDLLDYDNPVALSYYTIRDKGYIFAVLDGVSFAESPIFGFEFPHVLLVYEIPVREIDDYFGDTNWNSGYYNLISYFEEGGIPITLTKNNFRYGFLMPYFPQYSNSYYLSHFVYSTFVKSFIDTGVFPSYYELLSIEAFFYITPNVGSQYEPEVTFDPTMVIENNIYVRFNSANTIKGGLNSINSHFEHYDFPRFDWSYDGIGSLIDLVKELFSYTQDIVSYFQSLVSSCIYLISPFLYSI